MQEANADSSLPDDSESAAGPADTAGHSSGQPGTADSCFSLPRRFRYSCTRQEREEAQDLAFVDSHGGSKTKAIGCSLAGIGIGFVALLATAGPGHRLWVVVGVLAIAGLVMLLQKVFGNRSSDAQTELEVFDGGLRFIAGASDSVVSAASCEKLMESDRLFVLKSREMLILLPKRVFADERELAGFRELTAGWTMLEQENSLDDDAAAESAELPADAVSVVYQLKFRDYVDRFAASWRFRAMMLAVLMLFLVVFVFVSLQPMPNAVYSPVEVAFYFLLPSFFVQMLVLFVVICAFTWFSERRCRRDARVTIHELGIELAEATDKSKLTWSKPTRFKISPWSFFIWWPGTPGWFMIPKRAFASEAEIQRYRILLATHAEESTWFWG